MQIIRQETRGVELHILVRKLSIIKLLLILLTTVTGCATLTLDERAHQLALWNFHYVADVGDEWNVYDRIDEPFSGDCEDYAFSLQLQIGGDVWVVKLNGRSGYHAVLVKDGIVYDNIYSWTHTRDDYPARFIKIINVNQKLKESSA